MAVTVLAVSVLRYRCSFGFAKESKLPPIVVKTLAESLISLPVVPLNKTTAPFVELDGPTTAPSILVCTTDQSELTEPDPALSTIATSRSPISQT